MEASKVRVLEKVPCIYYPVSFYKDKSKDVLALLDFESKINAMSPAYIPHLGLKVRVTDVGLQKIDGSSLAIYGMVIATLEVIDKLVCSRFF